MSAEILILYLVHILFGIYWAGATFLLVLVIEPTVKKMGDIGDQFMKGLVRKSKVTIYMNIAALLTLISGILLYSFLYGYSSNVFNTSSGTIITMASLAGLLAYIMGGFFFQRPAAERMMKIIKELEGSERQPNEQQLEEINALKERIELGSKVTATLIFVSIIGMVLATNL